MKITIHSVLLTTLLLWSSAWIYGNIYPWTDADGRTLQAEFIEVKGNTLNINLNGQPFQIPMDSLSEESKALAAMLQKQKGKNKKELHDWTDNSGRTIKAEFVGSTSQSVTLLFNGRESTLPLSMFDPRSRELASYLGGRQKKESSAEKPVVKQTPVAPIEKVDLEGELKLENYYPWTNKSKQSIRGRFVKLSGENLLIELMNGRREATIALSSLSTESQSLAKKLNGIFVSEQKKKSAATRKRKSMKVPQVNASDLEITHSLSRVSGGSVNAKFVEADDDQVVLLINGRKDDVKIGWNVFSEESIALLEALRRMKVKVDSFKPKIVPAKNGKLAYYGSGKYKGYNTILEDEQYVVGLSSTGSSVNVFLKQEGASSAGDPLGVLRLRVGFGTSYIDKTDPKRHRRRSRAIKSFEVSPEPSTDNELIALRGTYTNGGTFEYNLELKKSGLKFWSKMKDPSGEKWPSSHRIGVFVAGVVANATNLSMGQINAAVGNGTFVFQPVEGKSAKVPLNMPWTDVRKKIKVNTNNLKSMELIGKPYNPLVLSIASTSNRDMRLDMDKSYSKTFPLQGVSLTYASAEEGKRQEVPKSKALRVEIKSN